jgi:U4/U6 small nuclear ribonucleoprotein PRP4
LLCSTFALAFSGDSYQLATGGEDDSIKIWDIRKLACAYTIPAHRSLVSDLKFFRSNSERLLSPSSSSSSSSDLYSSNSTATNGTTTTSSLQDTTMSSTSNPSSPSHPPIPSSTSPSSSSSSSSQHINTSGLYLVSSGYDSTIKIWSSDDWQLVKSITTDSGKVMAVDLDGEGKFMAAGSSNRNFQLFGGEDAL